MSCTWQKQRVCVPSPWISSGRPASAADTKVGMTMPYCPLWRGPTVLNSRTITQSSPRSWWYASARNSSSAFDSAYAQRRAVVGPYWRRLSSDERLRLAPVAVHLRRRRDEHALAEAVAVLEHVLRPLDVRDERVHRLLDDQADADRRGEVVDDVAAVDELVDDGRLENGVDDEVEVAAVAQMRDVALGAGGQVVEDEDLPAVGEEQLGEMRADEAGAAGDQGAAACRIPAHAARILVSFRDGTVRLLFGGHLRRSRKGQGVRIASR